MPDTHHKHQEKWNKYQYQGFIKMQKNRNLQAK